MPRACTKRSRNDDDPHLSPDDNDSLPSPSKRSCAQRTEDKKYDSGNRVNDDEDDETSTEPTSSSGSDSSVDSSDEDEEDDSVNEKQGKKKETIGKEEETVPSLSARQKPRIRRVEQNSDILSRITAFLPQMKSANEDLQRELAAGRGKEAQLDYDGYEGEGEGEGEEGEGRYIEMNLGLGVLEEKRPGDESDGIDGSDDEQQKQPSKTEDTHELPNRPKDSRVLGKLMGVKEESKKPTIEEMNE